MHYAAKQFIRRLATTSLAALLTVSLARAQGQTQQPTQSNNWNQGRGNAAQTGFGSSSAIGPSVEVKWVIDISPRPQLACTQEFPFDGNYPLPMLRIGNEERIYVGDGRGISAINDSGTILWQTTLGRVVGFAGEVPTTGGQPKIYAATRRAPAPGLPQEPKLYCVSEPSGSIVYETAATYFSVSPLVIANQRILFVGTTAVPCANLTSQTKIVAFNKNNGTLEYATSAVGSILADNIDEDFQSRAAPAVDTDVKRMYIVSDSGSLLCFDLLGATTTPLWSVDTGIAPGDYTQPIVDRPNNRVICFTSGGLVSFHADGTQAWTFVHALGFDGTVPPTLANGFLYVKVGNQSFNQGVAKVSADQGQLQWTWQDPLTANITQVLSAGNGTVWVCDTKDYLNTDRSGFVCLGDDGVVLGRSCPFNACLTGTSYGTATLGSHSLYNIRKFDENVHNQPIWRLVRFAP